ncbi:hypothetical protein [Massilia luteola]|uniref:hypothetical protein n=1 Tax=Massilia luteola TaxID=3081751 RepID=UPI002ACBE9F9|nr:hypothetical protein [Massilia sp. Gc5]
MSHGVGGSTLGLAQPALRIIDLGVAASLGDLRPIGAGVPLLPDFSDNRCKKAQANRGLNLPRQQSRQHSAQEGGCKTRLDRSLCR